MFTNMKIVPGFLLEGNGFDKWPNYDAKGLSEQPKWVSQAAVDAIWKWSKASISVRALEAWQVIRDTAEASISLAWFPDAKFEKVVNWVQVFKNGSDTIILSDGNGKTQTFPKRLFNESFISQFAANNGVKTEVATPTQSVAAVPKKAPRSHTDAVTDSTKRKWDLQNQIGEIDKAIAEFKQRLVTETPQATTPEKQNQLANLWRTIQQLDAKRGELQAQLQPLIDADNAVNIRESRRLADASRQRANEITTQQEKAEYAKLSPNAKILADYKKALDIFDASRQERLQKWEPWPKLAGERNDIKKGFDLAQNMIDNDGEIWKKELSLAVAKNRGSKPDIARLEADITSLKSQNAQILASINAIKDPFSPTQLAKAFSRPSAQTA